MTARSHLRRLALAAAGLASAAAFAGPAGDAAASQYQGFDHKRPVEITNSRTGLKADVMWASQDRHQGVFLWENNASASQEFDMLPSGGGYYRIRARHSGQCLMLDWREGTYKNGTRVIQYPSCDAGYKPAEWRIGTVSDPQQCWDEGGERVCSSTSGVYPVLVNRRTGKCLDAASGGTPRMQAVLQQWTCIRSSGDWNAANQLFNVRNVR